jgi:hypothetical protein
MRLGGVVSGRVEHPCSTAADQGWSALPESRECFPPPATWGRHPPPETLPHPILITPYSILSCLLINQSSEPLGLFS